MKRVAIIGGGPAGLMAAETAAEAGVAVTVCDAMPTVGRKFLMAGKSGLNITHAEARPQFDERYGTALPQLQSALDAFDNTALRAWCAALGIDTFVGSSGRIFPTSMKGSPLLRAWLARLGDKGVSIRTRHRWIGFDGDDLTFETPEGKSTEQADAVILALGGASWPRLGSDAAWVPWLAERKVNIRPFRPANCGFVVNWSTVLIERFAGQPVKAVDATSAAGRISGEFVVTRWGIEGSLVYAHAAALRDRLDQGADAVLTLDLAPGRSLDKLAGDFARQPAKTSFSNRLRKGAGLDGVKAGLLREVRPDASQLAPPELAALIKALPLAVQRTRPIAEAISSAGGVAWDSVEPDFMLKALPGVFVAGEMLDWEAPTGGYLLTACFATGRAAGAAAAAYARGEAREPHRS